LTCEAKIIEQEGFSDNDFSKYYVFKKNTMEFLAQYDTYC